MRRVFLVGTAVLAAAVATTADNGYDSNDGRNRGRNQSYAIGAWGDLPYSGPAGHGWSSEHDR